MYFRMGSYTRPLNEVVAPVTYAPKYSITRKLIEVVETWTITGYIVLQGAEATLDNMTATINTINTMFEQKDVDILMLDSDSNPTPWKLLPSQCSEGPSVKELSWTSRPSNIYANGQSYQAIIQATRPIADGILEFNETLVPSPGGLEYVYVGGAINWPERQVGSQHKTWRVSQRGMAVGLLGYPAPPFPIWPFALIRPESAGWATAQSPRKLGLVYDSEFPISWNYEFEWHVPLYGTPNRII